MYNPAKISSKRTASCGPQHTVYCICHQYCHALHILTANLCLNILHIKKNQKTKHSIFLTFTYFDSVYFFCIFFFSFLKNKPETFGLYSCGEGALRAPPPPVNSSKSCCVIKYSTAVI